MATPNATLQEDVSTNLIPMVDIMFLLLLFFMLSADMGQREIERVRLPEARSVDSCKSLKRPSTTRIINVYHRPEIRCPQYVRSEVCRDDTHWRTSMLGRDYAKPEALAEKLKRDVAGAEESTHVLIHADASAPYGLAQRAVNACAEARLYRVEVGAALERRRGG